MKTILLIYHHLIHHGHWTFTPKDFFLKEYLNIYFYISVCTTKYPLVEFLFFLADSQILSHFYCEELYDFRNLYLLPDLKSAE